jgi:hypothetical protein
VVVSGVDEFNIEEFSLLELEELTDRVAKDVTRQSDVGHFGC